VTPVAYTSSGDNAAPAASSGELATRTAGEQNPDALFLLLRDSLYPSQREWAAEILSSLDGNFRPQVLQALLMAAGQDAAATVRAGCVRCLARMNANTPPVLEGLRALRTDNDPRVRQEVDLALDTFSRAAKPSRAAGSPTAN
jgi:hypothetical protein